MKFNKSLIKRMPWIFILSILIIELVMAQTQLAPTGLICELLRFPEKAVITDPMPEFGWIVNDNRRGAFQTAYQILVASHPDLLSPGRADMWDSGKVNSSQSINVEYGGKPLQENSRYWWKVRIWDQNEQPSPFSKSQLFYTGTFRQKSQWPGESHWVTIEIDNRPTPVLENRQRAEYYPITPVQILKKSKGHYFLDFGRAAFATLKVRITSLNDNDSVLVLLGEKKTPDNLVDQNPGGSIGFRKAIILLQKGTHEYIVELPRHIAHYPNSQVLPDHYYEVTPFRYVELIGIPGNLKKEDVVQLALFYPFDDNASFFTSSNDNLNRVWELCKYTLKATPFLSLYCDGNRERMPYEADSYIQQLGHYCVDREYAVARYTYQFLIYNPSWPTEWHLHIVPMAWADYMYTGNSELLAKYYEELKKKTLIALAREDGLISTRTGKVTPDFLASVHYHGKSFRDIVDWPAGTPRGQKQARNRGPTPEGERDGYVFTDINTVVNAFHYWNLVLMEKIAHVLGKQKDEKFFQKRASLVKQSFNQLLLDKKRGIYRDGEATSHASLHANMFPLAFGLVPEEYIPSVVKFIKSRGMACSVYGAQYLLEGLFRVGEASYALKLMTSDSRRSWMNMIRSGSSMTTEAWDIYYKPNMTWNHAWGTAPANIITRKLMGIEPIEAGFKTFRIKPQPGNLRLAKIKMPTIRGFIECEWKKEAETFHFNVVIPANSKALIYLPTNKMDKILESNVLAIKQLDIRFKGIENNFSIFEIGAGQYSFSGPLK